MGYSAGLERGESGDSVPMSKEVSCEAVEELNGDKKELFQGSLLEMLTLRWQQSRPRPTS